MKMFLEKEEEKIYGNRNRISKESSRSSVPEIERTTCVVGLKYPRIRKVAIVLAGRATRRT